VAVGVLSWAGTLIIVRSLSTHDWGAYSFVFSVLGIVGLLCDLQVGRVVLRDLVADPDGAGTILGSFLLFRFLFGLVGYAAAVGIVAVSHYPASVVLITVAAGPTVVFGALGAGLFMGFSSRLWLRPTAVAMVLGQAVQLAAIVAIATWGHHAALSFAAASLGYSVVMCAYQLVVIRRILTIRLRVRLEQWKRWLREALPLTLGVTLGTIYFRVDAVILSKLKSITSVGYYNIGYKFSDLAGAATAAVFASALPLMVRAWPERPRRFHRTVRHALLLLFVVAALVGVEFACFGSAAINSLYGHRYRVTAGATAGLVASQLIAFFTELCFMVLLTVGRAWRYVGAALAGLALNVGLNLVFIPKWSYNGAAAAAVLTEIGVLLWLAPATASVPHVRPLPWVPLGKVAAAAAALGGVAWAARHLVPWPIGAAVVLLVFAAVLHFLRVDGPGGLRALWRPPSDPSDPAEAEEQAILPGANPTEPSGWVGP
jgi:O-antigen/teichoic acid export membrane protein